MDAIKNTIANPSRFVRQRQTAIADLYPYLGTSAKRAADCIIEFTERTSIMEERLLKTSNYSQLKALLSGANNSTKGINNIEIQHLAWLGSQILIGQCALEIGSHRGKSACCIASGIEKTHFDDKKYPQVFSEPDELPRVNCVDLWQDGKGETFEHYNSQETWETFVRQTKAMGFESMIVPHKTSSAKASRNYRTAYRESKAQPIGLLFIDGRHYKPSVEEDYFQWQEFIPSGGWIAFHDYGTRFKDVDHVVDDILKPSTKWDSYSVIGRIFTARKI